MHQLSSIDIFDAYRTVRCNYDNASDKQFDVVIYDILKKKFNKAMSYRPDVLHLSLNDIKTQINNIITTKKNLLMFENNLNRFYTETMSEKECGRFFEYKSIFIGMLSDEDLYNDDLKRN